MLYAPCKGCTEREVGCHANCERYAEFRVAKDNEKRAKAESRRGDFEINNYKKKVFWRQGNEKWG